MDLEQLRKRIGQLVNEGLDNPAIARKLKREGVKTLRGSRAPTATMVGYHVRKLKEEAEQATAPSVKPTPTTGRMLRAKNPSARNVQLAQELLAKDLPLQEKCELVASVLLS